MTWKIIGRGRVGWQAEAARALLTRLVTVGSGGGKTALLYWLKEFIRLHGHKFELDTGPLPGEEEG